MARQSDVLITYDVQTTTQQGRARLRRMARLCLNHGQRVQFSVFECRVTRSQLEGLEEEIARLIDPEVDSVRIYRLPGERADLVAVYGIDVYTDFDDTLIL